MKKILISLIILNCSFANAYEYSSDHNDRYDYERDEWHESNSRYAPPPRYLQNPQQPPIQIFLSPNMPNYERHHDKTHRHRHENNQYREERYWRERREELEQKPQRRGAENPFYQDDTHW